MGFLELELELPSGKLGSMGFLALELPFGQLVHWLLLMPRILQKFPKSIFRFITGNVLRVQS